MQDNHAELLLTTEALAEPGAGRVEANIIFRFSVGVAKYIRVLTYLCGARVYGITDQSARRSVAYI